MESKRDWSDSEDFVKAVWLMLNQSEPKEYVLSSNETHTVKEFVELAFDETIVSKFCITFGGMYPHSSWPFDVSNACKIPPLLPAYKTSLRLEHDPPQLLPFIKV